MLLLHTLNISHIFTISWNEKLVHEIINCWKMCVHHRRHFYQRSWGSSAYCRMPIKVHNANIIINYRFNGFLHYMKDIKRKSSSNRYFNFQRRPTIIEWRRIDDEMSRRRRWKKLVFCHRHVSITNWNKRRRDNTWSHQRAL